MGFLLIMALLVHLLDRLFYIIRQWRKKRMMRLEQLLSHENIDQGFINSDALTDFSAN